LEDLLDVELRLFRDVKELRMPRIRLDTSNVWIRYQVINLRFFSPFDESEDDSVLLWVKKDDEWKLE
jgi:hypothetical protein